MWKHKRTVMLLLTAFLIIAQQGCAGKTQEPVVRQSFYFDTVCSIAVYDMKEMSEEAAQETIKKIGEAKDKAVGFYEKLSQFFSSASDFFSQVKALFGK